MDTRRKKQPRPDKERDDYDREEDGPETSKRIEVVKNQVRNQKNITGTTTKEQKRA